MIVVVGVLEKKGKLYVQQRPHKSHYAGKWEFPGGKVMVGEQHIAALVRELKEELGIDIDEIVPLVVFPSLVPNSNHGGKSATIHAFMVGKWNPQPKGMEGQRGGWLTNEEIRKLDVLPNVPMILDAVENES